MHREAEGVQRQGHVRGRGGGHRHSVQDKQRTPSGQADGRDGRGADTMDLDAIAQVRSGQSCTEKQREVRAMGDEAYVEASTGDSMQLTRTRVHALRMKKGTQRAARADHASAANLCAIWGTWPCAQARGSKSRGRTPCVEQQVEGVVPTRTLMCVVVRGRKSGDTTG
jgi:hypothetical protein